MGAIASGGVRVMNEDVVIRYRPTAASIEAVTRAERIELERRERAYRNGRPAVSSEGRTVVLIDDGLATGATMRVAVLGVRLLGPARIVVAVPVGSREACEALREVADEVVCALIPEPFSAVGLWYEDFSRPPTTKYVSCCRTERREPHAERMMRDAAILEVVRRHAVPVDLEAPPSACSKPSIRRPRWCWWARGRTARRSSIGSAPTSRAH